MSVSMTWQPYKPKQGKSWGAGSTLHKVLTTAFGEFPIILNKADIQKLAGIHACGYDDVGELITALYDYDKIKLEDHW